MELKNGIKTFHARSRAEWREWLEQNHQLEDHLWLIIYHKDSVTPSAYYEKEKKMMPAGMKMVNLAKKTGTWLALKEVEDGVIPPDLQKLFNQN